MGNQWIYLNSANKFINWNLTTATHKEVPLDYVKTLFGLDNSQAAQEILFDSQLDYAHSQYTKFCLPTAGIYNFVYDHSGAINPRVGYQAPETPKTCTHSFKLYEGIMNRYNYCVHCDIKQDVQS